MKHELSKAMPMVKFFSSDNVTGACPEILAALAAANADPTPSYGTDPWTTRLTQKAQELFECDLAILPVTTGTAANAIALAAMSPAFGGIYCHETAHVMTDEGGAPEFFTAGAKLLGLAGANGKINAQDIHAGIAFAESMGIHHVKPSAVTVSQATEWGTVYSLAELDAITAAAHTHGLPVHMDGARFANALVHLGCSPAEATWKRGINVLSLGATKNGALAAEALIVFDKSKEQTFARHRKRGGHLWSKMRFLSAQLLSYLDNDLWLKNARHANTMAQRLSVGLVALGGTLMAPVDANEIFIALSDAMVTRLRADGYQFYDWPAPRGTTLQVFRLVTAYNTQPTDVDELLSRARMPALAP
jgi:threonine aldolase